MDDRYSMRAPLRPIGRGANPVVPGSSEDPLVELARIVSGRSEAADPAPRRRASSLADEPGMSEADLARDLEAELLSDLQASLAAVGEAHDLTPVDEEPSFTDEAYVTQQYRDDPIPDEEAYGFDPEPPVVEEPPASAGSLFFADEEPEDLRPYRPQQRQAYQQPPAPAALPPVAPVADFDHLGLRRGKRPGGPAYNPRALAPEPTAAPPQPAPQAWEASVRPAAHEQFEAVARQTFDAPHAAPDFRGIDEADERAEPTLGLDAEEDFRFAPIVPQEPARRSRGRLGTVLMGLVAVGVAVAAYIYFQGGTVSGDPPLILADTSPVRRAPANPTAPEPPNAVEARINPAEGTAPVVLGAGPETPIDTAAAATTPADGITTLIGGPAAAPATTTEPRTVRTVVLAPDGTIVNNLAGEPGIAPAPLQNPAAATTPAVTTPATTAQATTPVLTPEPAAATAPPLATTNVAPAPVAGTTTAGTPGTTPAAGTGIAAGWYVQVSSQTTEAAARADIDSFRSRAPSLLGSRNAVIPTATVNGVVRYRVQFGPAASQSEAQSLCNSLKAAGIDCITANNP